MPLRLTISAKPGKKVPSITLRDGILIVAVRERAIDGRANIAVERALAAWLGVGSAAVSVTHGSTGRHKYVDVAGLDPTMLAQRIAELSER